MTAADIIAILRNDYKLNITSYPDDLITRLITRTSNKISEYYPLTCIGSIDTVANQREYTVTDTGLMKLDEVFYSEVPPAASPFEQYGIYQTFPTGDTPSRGYSMSMMMELLRRVYPSGGEIISYNKFLALPAPNRSGDKIYYQYSKFRAITDIPSIFEEDVLNFVMYYLGDAEFKKTVLVDNKDSYMFDRRGNIKTKEQDSTTMSQSRRDILNDIIKNIKTKVMKL